MGLWVDEKVIMSMHGYLVVQVDVRDSSYRAYSVARGTPEHYVFLYRENEKTSFKDLLTCESYFVSLLSGLQLEVVVIEQAHQAFAKINS